ncbi:PepSY-associated TM helix domain-containing protein [Pseudoalteromonas sp. T1lg65]|uniref:PepSY-associated TM helix domain-containing protein n=1 Tax=Pseudoalteromonas sp. T1lg65 TaxID=2077101 RepID=UPI003F7A07DC
MKVRADILRTYQSIHTWTGITTGLLLFIGFFAGALTMFAGHIDQWASPPTQTMAQVESTQYDSLIQKVIDQHPDSTKWLSVNFSTEQSPITWYEQGGPRGLRLDDQLWHATLTTEGTLEAQPSYVNKLSALIDYLHRSAGIAGEIGHDHAGVYVLGIAAILYFVALVSGVIFLLPTLVKSFLALRTNKGKSRFWLDSHNLIGVTSLPFHIVIAITVIVFAFHDFIYDGLGKIYGDKPLFAREAPASVEFHVNNLPSITQIIAKTREYAPEHEIKAIQLSRLNSKSPSASIQLMSESHLMRGPKTDFLFMNPYTFKVSTSSIINGDQGIWGSIVTTMFGLHFGSYGGELGRWLYFLMGIMGAVLFYTGNLLWLEKRRKQHTQQSKPTIFMGKLTIGVALGSILGVAASFAITKWIAVTTLNVNAAYLWVYYFCFAGNLFAAFTLGMSITAIWTLRLISLLCLSLPATSILALLLPSMGLWPAESLSSILLECTAIFIGYIFWRLAQKTQHRAYRGDRNSIWYIGNQQNLQIMKTQSST